MYQETANPNTILRLADHASIPRDPANRDYQEFLAWQAAGGVILPYVPPPVDPPPPEYLSRNRFINGDMRIDQVNHGSAVGIASDTPVNALDMFTGIGVSTGPLFTLQRVNLTPPSSFTHYLKAAVIVADTAPAAGSLYAIRTHIEGINLTDFKLGQADAVPMALSFMVRSSLAGIYSGTVMTASGGTAYPFEYTLDATGTWERKTVLIPPAVSGTWAKDMTRCLQANFVLAAGVTMLGTPGAWTTQPVYGSTRQVNWMSSGSARTFDLTGLQLEPGPAATAFKYRPLSTEVSLAMRYLQLLGGAPGASLVVLQAVSTSLNIGPYRFPVGFRTAPTATIRNQTHFVVTNRNNGTKALDTLGIDTITPEGCRMQAFVSGGQSAGFATSLMCGDFDDAMIIFDARI